MLREYLGRNTAVIATWLSSKLAEGKGRTAVFVTFLPSKARSGESESIVCMIELLACNHVSKYYEV